MEAYCKIQEGAQVGQVVAWTCKACADRTKSEDADRFFCNVKYTAISAESGTAHGYSPSLVILDEAGQVRGPHDAFIEAIETAQGAHDDPLLIAISTQAARYIWSL